MIRIIAGGKKHPNWLREPIAEYEKRLTKPYQITWEFIEEEKLNQKLLNWPFDRAKHFVIVADERGENISSDAYSAKLTTALENGREVVILIGGAYGFDQIVRDRADFLWSFSNLIFPHLIARLIFTEQTYRAYETHRGSHYHHA